MIEMLTICMIVKNEERFLPEFLRHHRALTPHFVIVDTGSTDQTLTIAKDFGAECHTFQWVKDFSAARNFSLSQVKTPWILTIDPDERIAQIDFEEIHRLINGAPASVWSYGLHSRNYVLNPAAQGFVSAKGEYPLEEGQFPGWIQNTKLILFRNQSNIRFEGLVHETILKSVEGHHEVCSIPLHHYGVLPDVVAQKNKQTLYLEIAETKAAQNPQDARAQFELGMTYLELKEFAAALKALEAALTLNANNPLILAKLATTHRRLGQFPQAKDRAAQCLSIDLQNQESRLNLGMIAMEESQWQRGIEEFQKVLELYPDSLVAARNLAECYRRLNQIPKARALLESMLQRFPKHLEILEDLKGLSL